MTFLSDIRDYPWTSLLTGLLPARIVNLLPARFQTKAAQIVPSASIAGNALTVVIAIMSFLACLTAGAVYMVNQSANAWVNDIASEITVELDPINTADIEKKMTLVSLFLAKQKGITRVKPLTADDSAKLLEPWLGQTQRAGGATHSAPDRGRDRPLQPAGHSADQDGAVAELRGRHARRPPALAGRDQDHYPHGRARRARRAVAGRRRHHRRDRLGDAKRHGVEPRDHRGAAFRRRQ